ncbi:MAG: glutamate-5-semialdehyde dehydrogenase [Clostridiales Family XIII bacterium]|jgi:glutamate-5-semialdehyde dehydrogenase|nr:glutamate-5-semialdehyde dehydrogenase [Clostridiales Family XIII bacterium]
MNTTDSKVKKAAAAAKRDSFRLAALDERVRNGALARVIATLEVSRDAIIEENEKDIAAARANGLPDPIVKRLKFDGGKLDDVIAGIHDLIALPDPIGKILAKRQLDEGLVLEQATCPIGVVGVIFESRPDALAQIASLCMKSGNCAVLKGGSEAKHTNRLLYETIHAAGTEVGFPAGFLTLIESREETAELLGCHESIDLIIPRGSNAFVRYIMENSEIPVMGHADGVCHVYVDKAADIAKAVPIIRDSKVQYAAACNAVETVLVHADVAETLLPPLERELRVNEVVIRGTQRVRDIIAGVEAASEDDWRTEYLDFIVSVKVVDDAEEAIDHINRYGSHHTDCIVTEDDETAEKFMNLVDSASVYRNCSTRFADGFRYGLGAEVGISTGKLHARGPVGLDGLTTYKYRLYGDGQIVEDYAEGRRSFHFREIE